MTVAGIVLALIISVVLPRFKGITFALVTLGIAQVFYIVIQSRELAGYAGAEIGLQGVNPPDFLNPSANGWLLLYSFGCCLCGVLCLQALRRLAHRSCLRGNP